MAVSTASKSVSVVAPAANNIAFSLTQVISNRKGAGVYPGAFFVACSFICGLQADQTTDTVDCKAFGPTEAASIRKVIDGDTVRLKDGRNVRLVGINTPELGRDGKPDQPWSQQARSALVQFLADQPAQIIIDQEDHDKYGRVLAHLYNYRGQSAEAYLLQKGLAWHVAIPPNLTLADCLARAELKGRQQQLGIWGAKGITPVKARLVSRGGFQRVQGKVSDIRFGKTAWWIVLDNRFTVVIYPQDQHRFGRSLLQQLDGATIEVRGWVYSVRGKHRQSWRLKLETPYALHPK